MGDKGDDFYGGMGNYQVFKGLGYKRTGSFIINFFKRLSLHLGSPEPNYTQNPRLIFGKGYF